MWENVGFKHHYKYAFTSNFIFFIKRIQFIFMEVYEPYLGPKISYNLRKKGINVVTDAVPFQKVHFCTLFGVHISAAPVIALYIFF